MKNLSLSPQAEAEAQTIQSLLNSLKYNPETSTILRKSQKILFIFSSFFLPSPGKSFHHFYQQARVDVVKKKKGKQQDDVSQVNLLPRHCLKKKGRKKDGRDVNRKLKGWFDGEREQHSVKRSYNLIKSIIMITNHAPKGEFVRQLTLVDFAINQISTYLVHFGPRIANRWILQSDSSSPPNNSAARRSNFRRFQRELSPSFHRWCLLKLRLWKLLAKFCSVITKCWVLNLILVFVNSHRSPVWR